MDLYETLGVAKDATKDVVKKAFRRKAKEHHPDAGGDAKQFHAVELAHRILTDEEKRRDYDATGKVDDQPDTIDSAAMTIISTLVERFLDDVEAKHKDLIAEMRKAINGEIEQAMRSQREGQEYIARATDLQKRFKGPEILRRVVERRIDQAKGAVSQLDKQIAIRRKALKMLADAAFEVEPRSVRDDWLHGSARDDMQDAMRHMLDNSIFKANKFYDPGA
jgi:curved DNA-binding protein CbpA